MRQAGPALIAIVITTAAVLALPSSHAAAAVEHGLTFDGTAGAGSISVTLTSDRTGVQSASISSSFPAPIPGIAPTAFAATTYYDPPLPVTDGAFSVSVFDLANPLAYRTGVIIDGTIDSEGDMSGSARHCGLIPPGDLVCTSDVAWSATGPIDTPPSTDDLVVDGGVEDGRGGVTVTLDRDGRGVTSIALEALDLTPCPEDGELLDVFAFFDPPLALATKGGGFEVSLAVNGANRLHITGRPRGAQEMEGTVAYNNPFGTCISEVAWGTDGAPTPSPEASPAVATATPPPQLPPSGTGTSSGGQPIAWAAALLLAGAGALSLAAVRRGLR
jgi:hypothetical protein